MSSAGSPDGKKSVNGKKEEKKVLLSDFVRNLADESGLEKEKADRFIHTLFEFVGEELKRSEEDKLVLHPLGTFKKVWQEEKEGVNPSNGEPVLIPAHYRVLFQPSSKTADIVNYRYRHLRPLLLEDEPEEEPEPEPVVLPPAPLPREILPPEPEPPAPEPALLLEEEKPAEPLPVLPQEEEEERKKGSFVQRSLWIFLLLFLLLLGGFWFFKSDSETTASQPEPKAEPAPTPPPVKKIEPKAEPEVKQPPKPKPFQPVYIREYRVRSGDSFSRISRNFWGDVKLWPVLYFLNKDRYTDPDRIFKNDRIRLYRKVENKPFIKKAYRETYQTYDRLEGQRRNSRRRANIKILLEDGEILFYGFKKSVGQ